MRWLFLIAGSHKNTQGSGREKYIDYSSFSSFYLQIISF